MTTRTELDEISDERKEEIKVLIATRLSEGKMWNEIAEELKDKYGIEVTDKAVKYWFEKEVGTIIMTDEDDEKIIEVDTYHEKLRLYKEQIERLKLLRKLEKQIGMAIPETRKNIETALLILEKIREEKEKKLEYDISARKEILLGEILDEIDGE